MWALITHGVVAETTLLNPKGRFHPALMWVVCADQVVEGWTYADGHFTAPAVALPDLLALIAARRFSEEVRGITVDGISINTGRESQAMVTGAALLALGDPAYTCNWKADSGFVELNAKQLLAIASAVRTHVQRCFDREAELLAKVESGTFHQKMLEQGW